MCVLGVRGQRELCCNDSGFSGIIQVWLRAGALLAMLKPLTNSIA